MRQKIVFHQRALAKENSEFERIEDMSEMTEEHPGFWAFIGDKGYQGISEVLRAVLPKRSLSGAIIDDE